MGDIQSTTDHTEERLLDPLLDLNIRTDKDVNTEKDTSTEIFFEMHAPKIIIPQEMSSDGGYLLLDTGYLVVKGRMGGEGMSWDISLRCQLTLYLLFYIFLFMPI